MIRAYNQSHYHIPVFLKEVIEALRVKSGEKYIDATAGGGGHTLEILKLGGNVLAIDWDEDAISYLRKRLEEEKIVLLKESKDKERKLSIYQYSSNICLVKGNFANIKIIAQMCGFQSVAGIIFDLGVSSHQLDEIKRGFSFRSSSPLDMRMDKSLTQKAEDIINSYTEEKLYEIFTKFAEEIDSGSIVSSIIRARALNHIKTAGDLVKITEGIVRKTGKKNPATRIFQALRIEVNDELENLKIGLKDVPNLLKDKGRLAVISYHSLEDRIVKLNLKGKLIAVNKKPIIPTYKQKKENRRSSSAKLRIYEKQN